MTDPTQISLPSSVRFPVVVTGLLHKNQSNIARHAPLLKYKYWDYVEESLLDGEEADDVNDGAKTGNGFTNNSGTTPTPSTSVSLSPRSAKETSHSPGPSGVRKVRREFHSTFESPVTGTLHEYLVDVGDTVESSDQKVVSILEPCTHSVQYIGLCALCGASLDEQDYTEYNNRDRAPISMSHDTSGLKVSYTEAERIERSSAERLLDEKKLILVVDLDQTVIHAAVDPTIGEWMRDEKNPNHASLKDVKSFCLDEPAPAPPRTRGDKQIAVLKTSPTRYYVKLRPGLDSFLKSMSELYEMHIYTMATKTYAKAIANIIDPDGKYFSDRILSRDESGSAVQKSLQRLFPVSTSMVAIIDDRGDVWKWSDNLIKVVPYSFFVGIGDINSSFLPQRTGIIESTMRRRKSFSASAVGKLDKENGSKQTAQGENGTASTDTSESEPGSASQPGPEIELEPEPELELELEPEEADELSPVEQLVAIGGSEDNIDLLTVQASERSATLEAQQIERPLAKLQKDLDIKLHHREEAADSKEAASSQPTANSSSAPDPLDFTQSDHVLNDNDGELEVLDMALRKVHAKFYSEHAKKSINKPDLATIIPQLKHKVFDGCVFLFSGIVPLGRSFDTYDVVQWSRSFGAVVVADFIDNVTHVIATSGGTTKVRLAAGHHSNIKIVYPDWMYACFAAWDRVAVDEYLIEGIDPIRPALVDEGWLKSTSQQPEESSVEKFRQSLTDGDIDWDKADKELEEFMASDDEDDDDDDDDDDDNDNDDDNNDDNDKENTNSNANNNDDDEQPSNKRKRDESGESPEPTSKALRLEQDEEDSGYDDDEFARQLENDLM